MATMTSSTQTIASPDEERRRREEEMIFQAAQNGTLDPNSAAYRHAKMNGWIGGGGQVMSDAAMDFSGGGEFTPQLGERVGDAGWADLNMSNGEAQVQSFDQMNGIVDRAVEQNNAKKTGMFNTLASLMKVTRDGRVVPQMYEYANRSIGLDGVNQGIVASAFLPNGDFTLRFASKDKNGQVSLKDNVIPASQVLGIANANAAFSNEDVQAMRDALLRGGRYSDEEVNGFADKFVGKPGMFNRAEAASRIGSGTDVSSWFRGQRTRGSISAFGSNGRGGTTQYYSGPETGFQLQQNDMGTRGQNYQGKWNVLRSGGGKTVYKNDKTGDIVSVKDGETPPWLQSQFVGGDSKYRQAMDVQRLKNESNREVAEIGAKSRENVAEKTYYDRAEIEKLKADAKREGQEALTQRLLANVKQRYVKAFMDKYMSADEAEKMADRILSGVSEESIVDGAEKQKEPGKEVQEVGTKKPESASPSASQSTDNTPKRSFKEIKANPQDGDELPLKGGKKARYNGKTKKWEEVK